MSLVSDPSIFTKDRLREELQKHNVTLPRSDSKKSIYVDLYKRELLDKREKLEFSSDDEVELSSSRRKKKTATPVKKPLKLTPSRTSIISRSVDVTTLSDAELSDKLKEMGASIGPIMDSTRKIYQKKLEKLIAEAPREPPPVIIKSPSLADTLPLPDDFSDHTQDEEEEEEEEEEPEPEPPKPKALPKKSPARSTRLEFTRSPLKPRTTRSYESSRDQVDYTPSNNSSNNSYITRRYTTKETNNVTEVNKPFIVNDIVTQVPPPKVEEKKKIVAPNKRRFPVWLQVAIFVLLAIAIFLIIQNMEPAGVNPFKHLLK